MLAHGLRPDDDDSNDAWSGWAMVSGSTIVFQSTMRIRSDPQMLTNSFSIVGSGVFFLRNFSNVDVRLLGIRIG